MALCLAGCAAGTSTSLLPGPPPSDPTLGAPEPPPSGINFVDWADVGVHPNGFNFGLIGHSREATVPDTPSALKANATLTGSYSTAGLTNLNMTSGGQKLAFVETNEPVASGDPRLYLVPDFWGEAQLGYVADPFASGWNYQTFGIWSTSYWTDPDRTGRRIGAMTVGSETIVTDIPATGTATYTGFSTGNYFTSTINVVTANASANVDFAQRKVTLSLTDSMMASQWSARAEAARPDLNLSGTLNYASGTNGFAGAIVTAGGGQGGAPMSGTANGFFYGPGAAELGGVFWVTSGQSMAYGGAFGAKK
jgi:hypothetical protein